jgi:hypothetical protein
VSSHVTANLGNHSFFIRAASTTHFKNGSTVVIPNITVTHVKRYLHPNPKSGSINQPTRSNASAVHGHTNSIPVLFVTFTFTMMSKALLLTALVASTSAFAPAGVGKSYPSLAIFLSLEIVI